MGMTETTIDEAIKYLKTKMDGHTDTSYKWCETIRIAFSCMKKYQQIEQILDDCDLEAWEVLEKIKEVVANGRN